MDFMTISKAFLPYYNKKKKTFNQFQHLHTLQLHDQINVIKTTTVPNSKK